MDCRKKLYQIFQPPRIKRSSATLGYKTTNGGVKISYVDLPDLKFNNKRLKVVGRNGPLYVYAGK